MSNNLITSQPIPIKYSKNYYGFSNPDNNNNKYLFELVINGQNIGKKYFRNIESTKYSHLITIDHKIQLINIHSFKVSVSIYSSDNPISYDLEGIINNEESCSTQKSEHLYIEFTKNDMGYTLCSCFYTGLDNNKIFASPP